MARRHSGCEVLEQSFLELDLPAERFDGVFANAALFHVPSQELPRVLRELHATLKPRGVLFSVEPARPWRGGLEWRALRRLLRMAKPGAILWSAAGFDELTHYYRPLEPAAREQPWLASVWRKR